MNTVLQHADEVLAITSKGMEALKTAEEELPPFFIPLPDNALDGFRNGAILDLRVRLAMELLVHSPIFHGFALRTAPCGAYGVEIKGTARESAHYALDVATELFALAQARGLIHPLGEIDEHLISHIRRQVVYQIETQKEQQRQAEQSGRIAKAVHGAFKQ